MARKMKDIFGSFGKIDGSVSIGMVKLTFSSDKQAETLSLAFANECQITLQYHEIHAVANRVKSQMISGIQRTAAGYWEQEALTTGLYIAGKGNLIPQKGEVHINLRSSEENELLSIAFEDKGEISVPYLPVKELVAAVRGEQDET